MKFDCGMTHGEKLAAKQKWHKWFAWHPVRLGTSHDCRWLEVIERKGCLGGYDDDWQFEYRAIEDAS